MKKLLVLLVCAAEAAVLCSCNPPVSPSAGSVPQMRVRTADEQSNGAFVVGGQFADDTGVVSHVARLNPDGTWDDSFYSGGPGADHYITTLYALSGGKILVGGYFYYYNGLAASGIIRLNSDGTRDTTFVTGTGFDGYVNAAVVQSNGTVTVAGSFSHYNLTAAGRVVRILDNGAIDAAFNPGGAGANGAIYDIELQNNGTYIIAGDFSTYNGTEVNRIARLNADGTLDTAFNPGDGPDDMLWTTAVVSGGKVIIGGNFTSYNDTPVSRIARLNDDGSLDGTFNTGGQGADNSILTVAVQTDGRILIGGATFLYNEWTSPERYSVHRLNANGSLDATFSPGLADSFVDNLMVVSNNNIFVGGDFYHFRGAPVDNLLLLGPDGSLAN